MNFSFRDVKELFYTFRTIISFLMRYKLIYYESYSFVYLRVYFVSFVVNHPTVLNHEGHQGLHKGTQ